MMIMDKNKMLLLAGFALLVHARECPESNNIQTGEPVFTSKETGGYISVRTGHFAELECCVAGVDDVVWYKLERTQGVWEEYNISDVDENRVEFIAKRQVLVFKSVARGDQGSYMCRPKHKDVVYTNTSRKYTIEVVACDPLARGPYAIAPLPCEHTACDVGQDMTLPCTAYFGCNDGADPRLVMWFVSRDSSTKSRWIPATEYSNRFKINEVQRGNGAEIQSNLTIQSVTEEDLQLKFRCMLTSAQIVHGETNIYVKLMKTSSNGSKDTPMAMDTASVDIILVIVGAGGLMLVMLLIFVGVTVEQARRTRKHVSRDVQRKISQDRRPLNCSESDV